MPPNDKPLTGIAAFEAAKAKIKGEVVENKEIVKKEIESAMVELESLHALSKVGMSHVDPADIRPASVLLVQKLSDMAELVDTEGSQPKVGQFFDTGMRQIHDNFDCYVVFAKKGFYVDRRKPEDGKKPMYTIVGVMKDSMQMFGMLLRSSASYSLNSLFSSAVTQNYPMFVFNIHVESKELKNDQGSWFIPVFRVREKETNGTILGELQNIAGRFDAKADSVDLAGAEDALTNGYSSEEPPIPSSPF
jgi:hypothetical protein